MTTHRMKNTFEDARLAMVDGAVIATVPPGKTVCVYLEEGQEFAFVEIEDTEELPDAEPTIRHRRRK